MSTAPQTIALASVIMRNESYVDLDEAEARARALTQELRRRVPEDVKLQPAVAVDFDDRSKGRPEIAVIEGSLNAIHGIGCRISDDPHEMERLGFGVYVILN